MYCNYLVNHWDSLADSLAPTFGIVGLPYFFACKISYFSALHDLSTAVGTTQIISLLGAKKFCRLYIFTRCTGCTEPVWGG